MRADGSTFPIEIVVVRGERGGATIFLAYLRDLSERRASERALAEREAQFRTIAESVPVGLVISEIETGMPLYINPRARRNLGLGPHGRDRDPARGLGEARAARGDAARAPGPGHRRRGRGRSGDAGRPAPRRC